MSDVPRVLGIDSSLSSTGLCRIDVWPSSTTYSDVHWSAECATVSAPKPSADKSHLAKSRRITALISKIEAAMLDGPVDLVVLEGLAYSAQASTAVLSWVWGRIVDLCDAHGIALIVAAPTAVKKYATGKGNAGKDLVLLAAEKRWPQVGITGNDTADATVLAAMGCRYLGLHVESSLPAVNIAAMDKVGP